MGYIGEQAFLTTRPYDLPAEQLVLLVIEMKQFRLLELLPLPLLALLLHGCSFDTFVTKVSYWLYLRTKILDWLALSAQYSQF